jgi:hypothetical protein
MTTALASAQGQLAPLKTVDPKSVLERYLAEESTTEIAKSLGVTRSGLNYWLLKVAEEEWRSAQVVKALKRKEEAEELMEVASDALTLARAREMLRAAQWDLERVYRRIYGQEAPGQGSSMVQINIGIRRNSDTVDAQVIESDRNAAVSKSDVLSDASKESLKHAFPGEGAGTPRNDGGGVEQVADLSHTRAV